MIDPERKKLNLLTSTTNKKTVFPPKKLKLKSKENVDKDISGISPIKSPNSRRKVNFEKRNKAAQKNKMKGDQDAKIRRYEAESRSQKSRIQSLTQQLKEKDKIIRNLEHKLPKVLADVSRGFCTTREGVRKSSLREVRDTMHRNHILNQKIKDLERQLEFKEESAVHAENERLRMEIKSKDKLIRQSCFDLIDARRRTSGLEDDILRLHGSLAAHQQEVGAVHSENQYLYSQIRIHYNSLLETEQDINSLEQIVDDLSSRISAVPSIQVCSPGSTNKRADEDLDPDSSSGRKRRRWNNTWPRILIVASPRLKDIDSIPFGETCGLGVESENCELGIDSGNLIDFDMEQEMIAEDELADISAGELSFNDGGSMKSDDSNMLEKTSDWSSSEEFEDSQDKSQFCNRLEDLDFKLEILMNKLNTTLNQSKTTNQSFF